MKIILYVLTIVAVFGCSGSKDIFSFKKKNIVIGLKKGACEGQCSVYNMDIYKNQFIVYEGLVNAERFGIYSKQMTKVEYDDLKSAFDQAGFDGFRDEYPSEALDFPLITISYNNGKINKIVSGRKDRPEQLIGLQRRLEKIANSDGWKLEKAYEPQITNEIMKIDSGQKNIKHESQIIVEPAVNVSMAAWFTKYTAYEVELIKKISPNLNYWLITFNKNKISSEEMLSMIKKDKDIKSAEFNKVLTPRSH